MDDSSWFVTDLLNQNITSICLKYSHQTLLIDSWQHFTSDKDSVWLSDVSQCALLLKSVHSTTASI